MHKLFLRYRYSLVLLRQLVKTDFKLRYKGSVLGYLWTLLRPLALFAILYTVFVSFLKIGANIPHYAVYLLIGVVLWNYFVEVTMNGIAAIVGRGDLMRKLAFPRYVIVVSGSVSALINLTINLAVVVIFMIVDKVPFTPHALLIVPLIFELFVFALSIAFLLGALYVRFRDVNYIWEVILQAGFYATPILYPINLVVASSPFVAKVMMLNPVAQIIQDVRHYVVTPATLRLGDIYGTPVVYAVPLLIVAGSFIIATSYFKARAPLFAEEV